MLPFASPVSCGSFLIMFPLLFVCVDIAVYGEGDLESSYGVATKELPEPDIECECECDEALAHSKSTAIPLLVLSAPTANLIKRSSEKTADWKFTGSDRGKTDKKSCGCGGETGRYGTGG